MPFIFTFFTFPYIATLFDTVDPALLKIIFPWRSITLFLTNLLMILSMGYLNLFSLKCAILSVLSFFGLLFNFMIYALSQQFSNLKLVAFQFGYISESFVRLYKYRCLGHGSDNS